MANITPIQERALETVRKAGELHAYNGVSRATINVLERLGLVSVDWSMDTWTNYRTHRTHHRCNWVAKIK
jgi:hypothetical protein